MLFTPLTLFFWIYFPSGKHKPWIVLTAAIVPPLLLEILQWSTKRGILDIDDIILNASGWLLAYGFLSLIATKNSKKKSRYLNQDL